MCTGKHLLLYISNCLWVYKLGVCKYAWGEGRWGKGGGEPYTNCLWNSCRPITVTSIATQLFPLTRCLFLWLYLVVMCNGTLQNISVLGYYSCGKLLYKCVRVFACVCVYSVLLSNSYCCACSFCFLLPTHKQLYVHAYVCVYCNRWDGMFCKHLQAGTDVGVNEECGWMAVVILMLITLTGLS